MIAAATIEPSVTGETFELASDCQSEIPLALQRANTIRPIALPLVRSNTYPCTVTANQQECMPGVCGGASDYEQSIECADVNAYVIPELRRSAAPNAQWDNSVNPGGPPGLSAAGAECLTHASTAAGSAGQDLLVEPCLFSPPPCRSEHKAGPNRPLVTTSNSIVTIPIFDQTWRSTPTNSCCHNSWVSCRHSSSKLILHRAPSCSARRQHPDHRPECRWMQRRQTTAPLP